MKICLVAMFSPKKEEDRLKRWIVGPWNSTVARVSQNQWSTIDVKFDVLAAFIHIKTKNGSNPDLRAYMNHKIKLFDGPIENIFILSDIVYRVESVKIQVRNYANHFHT